MRIRELSGVLLAICAAPALAQSPQPDAPFRSGVRAGLPMSNFYISSQCMTRGEISPLTQKGANAHEVRLNAREIAQGFAVTGGGCEQVIPPGSPMQNYGHLYYGMPTTNPKTPSQPDGWQCKAGAPVGTPPGDYFRVRSHLVACRTVVEENLLGTQARWQTPGDGTFVTIARSGAARELAFPYSLKICNRLGGYDMEFRWRPARPAGAPGVDDPPPLTAKSGQCVEIDQPGEVMVRQVQVFPGQIGGTYELFAKGTFYAKPAIRDGNSAKSRSQDETNRKKPLAYAAPAAVTARCEPLGAAGDYPSGELQWRACALPLAAGQRDVRVCFGDDYIDNKPGGRTDYAVSLIGMVLEKPAKREDKVNADGWRWNSVFPGGCRDLFNVDAATVLVMSAAIEPEKPGIPHVWIPENVNGVRMTVQDIKGN